MKIEKWQVENGIAKPVNPYKEHNDKSKFAIIIKSDIRLYAHFVQQYVDIKFTTDAPPGIHSAEMFGEVLEQGFYAGNGWVTKDIVGNNSIWETMPKRSFLPFKHPVEPNDKQQYPPDFLDFCSIMETGKVQPLNPNANAIKILSDRMSELQEAISVNTNAFHRQFDEIVIDELNHILKLLQS